MNKQVPHNSKELTEREKDVLILICREYSSSQIAKKLGISRRTVDTHRQHITEKTGTKTLIGLVKYALRNGYTGLY